ncbi:MAG: LuxR C-terminal-related transcriptional regulator [Chloroflexota bacterium]
MDNAPPGWGAPLATRLTIPPPRPDAVARPRLIERLDDAPRLGHRLTLVSAPAGFGKTTLLSAWAGGSERAVTWLTLEESDADPAQFLTYLVAALGQIEAGIGEPLRQILQSPQPPPPHSLLAPLINDLATVETPFTLVLDDYHLVASQPVHEMLAFLLDHQPPAMHLVVSTREDPPLPLARLRARGQLTEIRERDLRFSVEEAAAFLNQTMRLNLTPEAISALGARTEGWIAGLQLAAVALQKGGGDPEAFVADFAGSDRFVMDYLVAEVLEREPAAVRDFLRQTAILDRLSAPLCEAVTGRADSQAILEGLEQANLFLVALDNRREWYRYHRLFAQVLRNTLDPAARAALHRRAMGWYEANDLLGEAIEHALAWGRIEGDLSDAGRLIERAAEPTLLSGNFQTVRDWLAALPPADVRASGALATYAGWVAFVAGAAPKALDYAQTADVLLGKDDSEGPACGVLTVLQSIIAVVILQDYELAVALAEKALATLSDTQGRWRVMALWALGEAQERTRPIGEAIRTYREAQGAGRAVGNPFFTALVDAWLASALRTHGERGAALAVCQESLPRYLDERGRPSPVAGIIYNWLAALYYDANQLDEAHDAIEQGVALSERLGLPGYLANALAIRLPIQAALGDVEGEAESLRTAHRLAGEGHLAMDWLGAMEANLRLLGGDVAYAARWAEEAGCSPSAPFDPLLVETSLTYGRLLLAQDRLEDAEEMVGRLARYAEERELYRWLIPACIQWALIAQRGGDKEGAVEHLARAVELAAPEGFYRPFLEEDPQALDLLGGVRQLAPAFVGQLLEFAGVAARRAAPAADQGLIEPLSERELEVLALIAEGLSNREIADRLYIAVGTVKRHINHIYGKLEVGSRTQAVARARQIRLLD